MSTGFFDSATGTLKRQGSTLPNHGMVALPHGNGRDVIASGGDKLRRFDAATGQLQRETISEAEGNRLSPDGSMLVFIEGSGTPMPNVSLLNTQTGKRKPLNLPKVAEGQGYIYSAFSPDSQRVATCGTDGVIRVCSTQSGNVEHELTGHTGPVGRLAWSPNGERLASISQDNSVRLWQMPAGKLVATYDKFPQPLMWNTLQYGESLAWSPDSRGLWFAMTANDHPNVVSLDTETGTLSPPEHFSNGNFVSYLRTSPDGQRLLAREGEGWTFVRGRDAQDRRLLGQHLGQTAQWHPDSRRFLGWENGYGTVGFDVETNRRLGLLFPWLTGDHWLCLGPTGHYRGGGGQHDAPASGQAGKDGGDKKDGDHSLARRAGESSVEDQIVYVAMLADGSQRTYTPAEFAKTFNWKNDPEKAELLGK